MAGVISNNPQKLSLMNLTGDKSVKSVKISAAGISSGLEAVGLMHHAPQAVVATTDHVGLVDAETGRAIRVIKGDYASTSSLQAVPNRAGLAIQQEGTGKIKVWDLNTASTTPIKVIPGVGQYPNGLNFNPTNPNQFISGSNFAPVRIFDFASGRATHTIDYVKDEHVKDYAMYGNAILRLVGVSGSKTKASLSLLENVNEEINSFTCSSSGDEMTCSYLTPTSAIVICSNCIVESRITK
jgi:WD40 repeat protein